MRTRRLMSDASAMTTTFLDFPFIKVQALTGDPPETYRIQYTIQSLERGKDGHPIPRDQHEMEIQLTSEYPRISPQCRMLTPIFHPNIDPATICVGDHWTAGEQLPDLVIRIGQMIAYQEYNIRSPLDAEAAMWADLNSQSLPIDSRDLHPPERAPQ
jgi:ubiquitin-protein ligase